MRAALKTLIHALQQQRRRDAQCTRDEDVLRDAGVGLATLHPSDLCDRNTRSMSERFLSQFAASAFRLDVQADPPEHVARFVAPHRFKAFDLAGDPRAHLAPSHCSELSPHARSGRRSRRCAAPSGAASRTRRSSRAAHGAPTYAGWREEAGTLDRVHLASAHDGARCRCCGRPAQAEPRQTREASGPTCSADADMDSGGGSGVPRPRRRWSPVCGVASERSRGFAAARCSDCDGRMSTSTLLRCT